MNRIGTNCTKCPAWRLQKQRIEWHLEHTKNCSCRAVSQRPYVQAEWETRELQSGIKGLGKRSRKRSLR